MALFWFTQRWVRAALFAFKKTSGLVLQGEYLGIRDYAKIRWNALNGSNFFHFWSNSNITWISLGNSYILQMRFKHCLSLGDHGLYGFWYIMILYNSVGDLEYVWILVYRSQGQCLNSCFVFKSQWKRSYAIQRNLRLYFYFPEKLPTNLKNRF